MKGYMRFLAALIGTAAIVAGVASIFFRTGAERQAVWIGAGIVVVVQAISFAATRQMGRTNMMAGWGLGALLRMTSLVVYGLVATRMLHMPPVATLLSVAALFFVTTLIEPFFLKTQQV